MIRIHPFHLCGAHRGKGFKGWSQDREENTDDGGYDFGTHTTSKDDHNGCSNGNDWRTVEDYCIGVKHLFQRPGPEEKDGCHNGRERPDDEADPGLQEGHERVGGEELKFSDDIRDDRSGCGKEKFWYLQPSDQKFP